MNKINVEGDWYIVIRNKEQHSIAIQFFKIFQPQLTIPDLKETDIIREKIILITCQNNQFEVFFDPDSSVARTVIENNITNVSNPFYISFNNEKSCEVTLLTIDTYIHLLGKKFAPHENFCGAFSWEKDTCPAKYQRPYNTAKENDKIHEKYRKGLQLKNIIKNIEEKYLKGGKSCA